MKLLLTYDLKKLMKNYKRDYKITEKENLIGIENISKQGRPHLVKLPSKLTISPEVAGLIVGEGYLGGRSFVFANSNEKAIDLVLDFLRQFKIPVRMYLEISTKNVSKKFIKNSQYFWENHLNIKLDRVRKREEFNNITKNGTIHLCLNGKIICEIIEKIINLSKRKAEKNKNVSTSYLKGIIAAEGNINVKGKTNCLYMVRISATKQEERNHYKRCLNSSGVNIYCKDMLSVSKEEAKEKKWKTTKGRAGCVIISRWENFVKVLELGLLDLNIEKREKFIKSFINNKFTKQFLDFKYFIDRKFSMKDAQNYFNLKGRYLNRVLTLYNQGYIKRKKLNKVKFEYMLTKEYLNLYNKIIQEARLFQITPSFNSQS